MLRDSRLHLVDHVADPCGHIALELRQPTPRHRRRVLLQFGPHRGAAVAREIRQLHFGLLNLAAQCDGSLGLGHSALTQNGIPAATQCRHPRLPVRARTVLVVARYHRLQTRLPRPQPVSSPHIDIVKPRAQQVDEFIDIRLAEIGGRRHADPRHIAVALGVCGEPRLVLGHHVAPVAVNVDLRHRPDYQIGVLGREIDQGTVGFGDRSHGRHHEHDRGRRVGGADLVGFDELVLGQPFPQRRDQTGRTRQPRPGDEHDVSALHTRRAQPRIDPGHQCVHRTDRVARMVDVGHRASARRRSLNEPRQMSAAAAAVKAVDGTPAVAVPVHGPLQMRRRVVIVVDRQARGLHHVDGGGHRGEDGVVAGKELGHAGTPPAAIARSRHKHRFHPPVPHLRADRGQPRHHAVQLAEPTQRGRQRGVLGTLTSGRARHGRCRRGRGAPAAAPARCAPRCARPPGSHRSRSGRPARQTSARSAAASSSSSAPAASRPTIGTVGTPVSAWSSAARRSATAIGPPAPKPARSALLSTISVGIGPTSPGPRASAPRRSPGRRRRRSSAPVMTSPRRPALPPRCPGRRRPARSRRRERAAKPADDRSYPRITCAFSERVSSSMKI